MLLRPRSIAGATAWGMIVAVVVFGGLILADFTISMFRSSFGPARQIDSIAVGAGYSISLDATPSHPWLAEYRQSVGIYRRDSEDGSFLGRVDIPNNTGGRIRIGILAPKHSHRAEVVLADRDATTRIDLATQTLTGTGSWRDPELAPLGIISGESYPVKFIPCAAWPLLSTEEREAIIRPGNDWRGFCDRANASASGSRPQAAGQ